MTLIAGFSNSLVHLLSTSTRLCLAPSYRMSATRTSTRRASLKAKEAIAGFSEKSNGANSGVKRRQSVDSDAGQKLEKKNRHAETVKSEIQAGENESTGRARAIKRENTNDEENGAIKAEEHGAGKPEEKLHIEAGIRTSEERESIIPSNILEKGIIYFFYRPRVNVEEAHGLEDVSRSFLVLRPTPRGAILDHNQGPVAAEASCRLLMLPKKKFPTSGRERDMGFVEKAGASMKQLHESFIAGREYETMTKGHRHLPEAKPYAEGVYAITSTKRASHLAYILTIPSEVGDLQHDFGLYQRGSWIVQSKSPKFAGPSYARLPKNPEYPKHILDKFRDLRWVPLEPEFIDYPNAQFLMIGEAHDGLGKAAIAEPGGKTPEQEEPGEELEKLEHENEDRIEALSGDHSVYQDLGLDAKSYPDVPSTWAPE